ncbi:MAG: hypothetical protein ACRD1H_14750 [Vicinamibacterales bacterium]
MPRALTLLLVLIFFTAVASALTFPLVRFDRPVLPDTDDAYFNVWRLSWVAHQIVRAPWLLFDTNIFYPLRNTLAYSDAMLALGLIATPAINLGLHPVIVHNILVLGSFVTAGFAAFLLCRHLTGSTAAALVGGLIFAFAPYRFAHIAHLELLWTAPMPLALFILHVESERPVRKGMMLGAVVALQAFCSLYYAAFLAIFIGLWTLVALVLVNAPERRRLVQCLIVGGVTGLLLTAPYGSAYYNAHRELGGRKVDEMRLYSATPADYLRVNAHNRLYRPDPLDASEERNLFPGITAAALALCGLLGRRDRIAVLYGVLTACAFDLSLGLNGLTYPIIASVLPLMDGFRAPARFSSLFLLSLSVLAALGVAAIAARLSRTPRRVVVSLLAVLCLAEYFSAPISTRTPILTRPAVYQWLRSHSNSVILEMPIPTPSTIWNVEATHQYMSIFHWARLVNGYSGYAPRSYFATLDRLKDLPSPQSVAWLRELGVEYVIVHERFYEPPDFVALVAVMMQSPDFDKPLTMPDPDDPVYVFPLRPAVSQ